MMVEVIVAYVKARRKRGGRFTVTIPIAAAKRLRIEDKEPLKVLVDTDRRRVIYQLMIPLDLP